MKRSKLVSLLGISLLLVGCGNSTDTAKPTDAPATEDEKASYETNIVIGASATQKAFVKEQAESWLAKEGYKKVTVEMYEVGEDKATDITDWTAAGAPDIYGYASDKTGDLYKVGALAEVPSAYVAKMNEGMGTEATNAAILGDSYYGYPYAGDNGYFLYYNKDVVSAEQAKSVEGILEACQAKGQKFGYALDTNSTFFSIGTFMSFGARYNVSFNADGTFKSASSDFDGEKGILGAKAVNQLALNKNVDITNDGARNKAPTAANGYGAVVEGSWNYKSFSDQLGDKLGACKLPTITVEGQTANLASFLGYKLYGVNPKKSAQDTKRLSLLHTLTLALVSDEVQEARFDALNVVPTQKAVKALDKVQQNGLVKALADQAAYSVPQTVVPGNIWTGAGTAVEALKAENPDYQTIMKTFADTIATSK